MCFSLTWPDRPRRQLVWRQGDKELLSPGLVNLEMPMRTGVHNRQGGLADIEALHSSIHTPEGTVASEKVNGRLPWKWAEKKCGAASVNFCPLWLGRLGARPGSCRAWLGSTTNS